MEIFHLLCDVFYRSNGLKLLPRNVYLVFECILQGFIEMTRISYPESYELGHSFEPLFLIKVYLNLGFALAFVADPFESTNHQQVRTWLNHSVV